MNRPNILGTTVGAVFLELMHIQDLVKGVVLMVALLLTSGVRRHAWR